MIVLQKKTGANTGAVPHQKRSGYKFTTQASMRLAVHSFGPCWQRTGPVKQPAGFGSLACGPHRPYLPPRMRIRCRWWEAEGESRAVVGWTE